MKTLSLLLLLMAFLVVSHPVYAQVPPSAADVLKEATEVAAKENKHVFIIFHASWCGWCHRMDSLMNSSNCKPLFDQQYVIRHLVVNESEKNKGLENPGAAELMAAHNGAGQGIPFWLILDSKGNVLTDSRIRAEGSNQPGDNSGCPDTQEEVSYFARALTSTSHLTEAQVAVITTAFKRTRK